MKNNTLLSVTMLMVVMLVVSGCSGTEVVVAEEQTPSPTNTPTLKPTNTQEPTLTPTLTPTPPITYKTDQGEWVDNLKEVVLGWYPDASFETGLCSELPEDTEFKLVYEVTDSGEEYTCVTYMDMCQEGDCGASILVGLLENPEVRADTLYTISTFVSEFGLDDTLVFLGGDYIAGLNPSPLLPELNTAYFDAEQVEMLQDQARCGRDIDLSQESTPPLWGTGISSNAREFLREDDRRFILYLFNAGGGFINTEGRVDGCLS